MNMNEIILAWRLTDGTRCVVVGVGREYDLCVVMQNTVFRCQRFVDVIEALDVARRWRSNFEELAETASARTPGAAIGAGNVSGWIRNDAMVGRRAVGWPVASRRKGT
jgi:hypothetical protein